jgi:exopolyphosphatase/guanosine-5'-triphosphate,3'-diphosphate pyrophosphatase
VSFTPPSHWRGFSGAALVRGHRRKFANEVFDALPEEVRQGTRRLCVLLRLAVLVHRGRSASGKPMLLLEADNDDVRVSLPTDWLENHPLTRAELEEEAQRLQAAGYRMRLS